MNSQISIRESSKKPRIAIDVTSAIAQGAGIGRYTRELVGALIDYDNTIDYCLFSAKLPPNALIADRIPSADHVTFRQAPLSERWLYRLWYRLRIPLSIQRFTGEIDLYHSPDFVLPPVGGDIPTLLTVHDLSFVHFPEAFTPSLTGYLNRVVPRSVRRATHILADSQVTKDDLMDLWGIDKDRVSVLYSGVSQTFRPLTEKRQLQRVRKKYSIGDSPYILSVGTIQPRKNYQMLIRAFKQLTEHYPHLLVIVGGKGWLSEETYGEIDAQGLEGKVIFAGFVEDADLPALYSGATLFTFPSLYEGFGLPLLEAMACGVPVITSNASCLPEVAGEAALKLSPQQQGKWTLAMRQLLDDPAQRAKMVAAGFLQARRFSWQNAAAQLAEIYQLLLA